MIRDMEMNEFQSLAERLKEVKEALYEELRKELGYS
jgi:hypothetical protein